MEERSGEVQYIQQLFNDGEITVISKCSNTI